MTAREIEERIDELYGMLDTEPLTPGEKEQLRKRIRELGEMDADPEEFELTVTIKGTANVTAETLEDAKDDLYDCLKNNEYIVVESIEIEEV